MKLFGFLASLLLILAAPAHAALLDSVDTPQSRVEIHGEVASVRAGEPFWLIFRVTPIEGWHSYWKNPGDSGLPPILKWRAPEGVVFAEPLYPVPHRMPYGPLMNYGYEGPANLLIRVDVPDDLATGDALQIQMDGEWLVCEEQCIPQLGTFEFELPIGAGEVDPSSRSLFADARGDLAQPAIWSAEAEFSPDRARITVFMSPEEMAAIESAYVFPLQDTALDYAADQTVDRTEKGLVISAARFDLPFESDRLTGILAIEDGSGRTGFRLDADAQIVSALPADTGLSAATDMSLIQNALALGLVEAVLFALVGGLILNLMPCVFPVLSLKAMALIRSSDVSERQARLDGLAYTAGIVVSFLVLAGVLLILRAAGEQIGWGFQLQSPLVIGFLALLLFTIGLNFAGYFEFGGSIAGFGQNLAAQDGLKGSFFTGVLATIVATPCTAPFMASALGFAMIQPAPIALGIFASLGVGLALPFLLVAFVPPLRRALPKPGPWMDTFKQALAFPLFLAVIWLVWVLSQQAGSAGVALVLTGMLVLAFLIWLYRTLGKAHRVSAHIASAVVVGLLGYASLGALTTVGGGEADLNAGASELLNSEPFTQARLDELRSEDRPVFVYFTAAWCVTCKVNERIALDTETVRNFVSDHDIAVLKGDWTSRDSRIAAILDSFGRSGVPLYLFYGNSNRSPVVMPQVLTPRGVVSIMREELESEGNISAKTNIKQD